MNLLLCVFVAVLAGIVQTLSGFGSAVVLVLFLQSTYGMLVAPAIATSVNLVLTTSLAIKYRKYIEWDIIAIPAVVYVAMNTFVITLAKHLNLEVLKKAFGVFLLILAVYSLFYSKKIKLKTTKTSLAVFSVLSGVTGGLFSVGGPLLALYYSDVSSTKESYLANMQFLFMLVCITATITRIATHIYTFDLLPVTLSGFVGVIIGREIALRILKRLDKSLLTKIVYVFVALSGLIIIL